MGIEFFDGTAVTGLMDIMSRPTMVEGVAETYGRRLAKLDEFTTPTVVFTQPETNGVSIVHFTMDAGHQLPSHSHSADCLYYVLAGEVVMGKRSIKPGGGFFVPADTTYTYKAGAEGVTLIEFRTASTFDMQITEHLPARWEAILGEPAPVS
jgi:quercetin dioxygenase-like cupin family protein